jgi:hypothetical protein
MALVSWSMPPAALAVPFARRLAPDAVCCTPEARAVARHLIGELLRPGRQLLGATGELGCARGEIVGAGGARGDAGLEEREARGELGRAVVDAIGAGDDAVHAVGEPLHAGRDVGRPRVDARGAIPEIRAPGGDRAQLIAHRGAATKGDAIRGKAVDATGVRVDARVERGRPRRRLARASRSGVRPVAQVAGAALERGRAGVELARACTEAGCLGAHLVEPVGELRGAVGHPVRARRDAGRPVGELLRLRRQALRLGVELLEAVGEVRGTAAQLRRTIGRGLRA